jgi:trans-feruloyl-CoA hydratase/vanillin synthase
MRRMTEMTYDNAEDYLIRAQEALHSFGGVEARKEATRSSSTRRASSPALARSIRAR